MIVYCPCADWVENLPEINGPIVLQQIRSGGNFKFKGKPFFYCPWCGNELLTDLPRHGQKEG